MPSHYDTVLAEIPGFALGGVIAEYIANALPAVVPFNALLANLPLMVVGFVAALLVIARELARPPTDE